MKRVSNTKIMKMIQSYLNKYLLITIISLAYTPIFAQETDSEKYIQSDVIPMMDKKGFSFQTKMGDFILKPYTLVQSAAKFNYYDDEGLELSDQDN
ncbi:MAG: hypothetical protein LBT50_08395, partial [Prevotellaceae bacterium]|nr:hypothetical protein [Prevotellaceae bacterium]